MGFRDREEAAEKLAGALMPWAGHHPLVAAIPRGAVPMGAIIARRLQGELDIVLVRKLPAPGNPEFAIGAVDETGWTYLADYAPSTGASEDYIARQKEIELATMRERRKRYTPDREALDARGRVVIVVDDGLATGATMLAALHAVRAREPERLVCAVPVASPEALEMIRPHADDIVCLEVPRYFYAVGQAYWRFPQVPDDEVIDALRRANADRPPKGPAETNAAGQRRP